MWVDAIQILSRSLFPYARFTISQQQYSFVLPLSIVDENREVRSSHITLPGAFDVVAIPARVV